MALNLEVVSNSGVIWKGQARILIAPGTDGELGILGGHAPLLATLKSGHLVIKPESGEDIHLYVSGGLLEVQPKIVTVLTDTALRAETLDEAALLSAKTQAEAALKDRTGRLDYALVQAQLIEMTMQLRSLERLRQVKK